MIDKGLLAPVGSTGNNTHEAFQVSGDYETVALQFVVEAVGATPTVTYKFQGSVDGVNWYDVAYVTDASDTLATATRVMTAVGAQISFVSNPVARRYAYFRAVTSANTNVTYRAEVHRISSP